MHGLQISIITLIAQLPRPAGVVIDWLSHQPSVRPREGRASCHSYIFLRQDDTVSTYIDVMRTVYRLAQSLGSHSMALHRVLFSNLEADSLAFLAGVWTGSSNQDLCAVSLRHAFAFLQAHCSADEPLDFQTVLPSLVVALQTLDMQGREAALQCIGELVIPADKRFCAVYCLDTIYGSGSGRRFFNSVYLYIN